ncbi:MAG: mucoidy inhibitor MuiA family protein, partial [Anaerohalosphaeraceae bacterium]
YGLSVRLLAAVVMARVRLAEPVGVGVANASVSLYRGQALVTRTIEIPSGGGDMELLVENLPEKILPESLYAQSDGTISVLSVRYREKVVKEDMREEVKALQEQILALKQTIQNAGFDHQNCMDRIDRYREQWKLSVDSTNADLNRGILQPEAVQKLTEFLEKKSVELHKESVRLVNEKQDLERQLAEAEKKLNELQQGQQRVNRQALVYIARPENAKASILLSYLVRDANWQPQYNLRAVPEQKAAGVEYNALVQQSSGEDWGNTTLALSTAEPMMISTAPSLEPMMVTLGSGEAMMQQQFAQQPVPQAGAMGMAGYADQGKYFDSLIRSKRENIAKGINAARELNQIAISNQMIELEADKRQMEQMQRRAEVVARTEGVSVMYALKGKLSLPSRTEQQILNIASFECPGQYVFVASPLLTDYVYLQGEITNTGETILLPGPASMFRNGEFVGRSDMKLVTSGQTFTAGFGIDSQIQVVREFVDKKIETQLGSRYNEQHYRIALSNYKAGPVAVRLLDRVPWTENGSLSIELKNVSHPLSEDAEYLRTEKNKGILRWDLQLDGGTFGPKATIVTYCYGMKYDKSLTVIPAGPSQ